jgi:predicted Zn-dependent peptidase
MKIPAEAFTLSNGLLVTLSEDHTAPIVAVNLWYHVGSANERPGRTGFAHLFEHMLFQGSANVGTNEHFELVQRAGGTLNGSTWLDRTNYFETVPSHHVALALWLEADRMGRLLPAMTQEKLDTQRDVVKNERRWSVDNQPYGTWWEKLPALAFPEWHPFHHSLIGSMEHLTAASLEDVQDFFRLFYTPDNAVLTIAGDFDPHVTKQVVEEYFGPLPRGPGKPAIEFPPLPSTFGAPLRSVVEDDVMLPRIYLAMRSPVFGSDEYYAASLCGAILGLKKGSRLYRTLVRERQMAAEVNAFTFDLSKSSDLLVVDVMSRPETELAALEHAVHEILDDICSNGVGQRELERALAIVETEFLAAMQVAADRADKLSMFATYFGDPRLVNEQVAKYRAVSTDRIADFALKHLARDNRASLIYVPRESARAAA